MQILPHVEHQKNDPFPDMSSVPNSRKDLSLLQKPFFGAWVLATCMQNIPKDEVAAYPDGKKDTWKSASI